MIFNITFIMQSLNSHSYFWPEKQCFKFQVRETKEERGTMYCQIAVNARFHNVNHTFVFIFIFARNHTIHVSVCTYTFYFCLICVPFLAPCAVSEGIVSISACQGYIQSEFHTG